MVCGGVILPVTGGFFPLGGLSASVFLQWVEDLGRWEAYESPDSSSDWRDMDAWRVADGAILPVAGGFWTLAGLLAGSFLHRLEVLGR